MKNTARIAAAALALMLAGGSVISVPVFAPETVVCAEELPAPTDVKAVASVDSVTLTWTAVEGADAYRIYKYDRVSQKFLKTKSVTGNSAYIKDLQTNNTYYFKVAALRKEGNRYVLGGISEKVTAKTGTVTVASDDYVGLTYKKGRTYYMKNGEYVTGLQKVGDFYYYFYPDKNYAAMKEWVQIEDEYYYFADNGRAATGTKKIDGKSYSFDRKGRCINYEQVTKKTVKGKTDKDTEAVKPPELPEPKDAGLNGSATKSNITVNCGPKDNKTDLQAKDDVMHAFSAYRFKIVNKYGVGSVKPTTSKSDVNKFDAYYDIYYKGQKVYSYHEYYEITPNKYCKGNIEITKS